MCTEPAFYLLSTARDSVFRKSLDRNDENSQSRLLEIMKGLKMCSYHKGDKAFTCCIEIPFKKISTKTNVNPLQLVVLNNYQSTATIAANALLYL